MRHATESETGSALLDLLRDPTDHTAWTSFVMRYGPKIAGWCRRCRLQEAAVEDVTQNVLTILVRRLRTFAYREALRSITFDRNRTRFEPANAADGVLLRLPPTVELPGPFSLALDADTISIDSEGGFATSDDEFEVEFYAVPLRPDA